jgi:hypothetical protein
MAAGATYVPIATQTLGSAVSSITFSAIAATWTDLRVIFTPTWTTGGYDWTAYFNGDTGNNYSNTYLIGSGSSVSSASFSSQSNIGINSGSNAATVANIPELVTLDLFNYKNTTTYKTFLYSHLQDHNGSGTAILRVGLYRSTSAITSITAISNTQNFAVGSTFTLYGIAAA